MPIIEATKDVCPSTSVSTSCALFFQVILSFSAFLNQPIFRNACRNLSNNRAAPGTACRYEVRFEGKDQTALDKWLLLEVKDPHGERRSEGEGKVSSKNFTISPLDWDLHGLGCSPLYMRGAMGSRIFFDAHFRLSMQNELF